MNSFKIEKFVDDIDDGIGGYTEGYIPFITVEGYIDLIGGSDLNTKQNAITEESTHILILPEYTNKITNDMRVIAQDNRYYAITYSDNPVGLNHHNEIYLKYGGVING